MTKIFISDRTKNSAVTAMPLGWLCPAILLIPGVAFIGLGAELPEERDLDARFGEPYRARRPPGRRCL